MIDHASSDGADVHVAITRVVRPGKEAQFEEALKRFIQRSLDHDETCGAHLLRPAPRSGSREYGILRSFRSSHDRDAFYGSQFYSDWEREVSELVEGEPICRPLHGLEAFFRGDADPPPRWKMATVTWLGVWPTVLFWSGILGPALASLNVFARTAINSVAVVATLVWLVMPFLTKAFSRWLRPKTPHTASINRRC